jgi:Protein kinase domain/Bacterial Ig-like domain (group 3)/IPT/TIG domain
MRDDTVTTGHDGYGFRRAGAAGWSVPGYTELKALGSGGAGDVVLARHDASGTRVAIKYLRRKLLADPQWAGLFRTEAQVLAVLEDPNIVRLYEYVESPSGAAIVMELVDGVSVREILAHEGGTTAEAALVVLRGSLLGLAAAHRRGVVHRDYKPENVLVDGTGHSKLTDFGIAARAGAEAVAAGSLLYAPPEQFAGIPASPAGDVYAATATFYECLTGRPPFVGDTAERLLYQHLAEPVPLDPVPEPLRPLVVAGMAKEPGDRPADAAVFVTALNAVAARAYGPDWADRGRSHLGEGALLLAALWPSGAPAAVQGSAVEQVRLSRGAHGAHGAQRPPGPQGTRGARHWWHVRHVRHLLHLEHLRNGRGALRFSPVKAAVAAGTAVVVAGAGVALAAGLAGRHGPPPAPPAPPAVALPAVTGVAPDGGTDVGGTTVTITGTGLGHATLVTFGGVAGRIISRSDTQLTVVSPPSTSTVGITETTAAITADSGTRITGTGIVDITVTTPTGVSRLTAADHYTFGAPRPAVTGVAPDGGSTAGGTTVSITGTGLAGATAVTFGGRAGKITSDSNTQITVTSPPGTGAVTVTVTTPAGTSAAAAGRYTYAARPKRPQSISFTAPATAAAGASAALPTTGGGSSLPVVFSVDRASGPGVCTVSGRTVTYAIAGPCVIDANQAGNATWAAAAQVQHTITVTGKSQSITFTAPASGTVGDSATLAATGGGSGNPVMFSVDNPGAGVCTVSGDTVTYTAAGSCVIDANQAGNATWAAAPMVQGTITVRGQNIKKSPSATTTALSSSANPSVVGQSVTFTATVRVNPPGGGTPAGTVAFSDGGTAISGCGAQPVDAGTGTATCTVTYPSPGSHSITASYGGDGNDTASTSAALTQTVNQAATTTALSSSPNPSMPGQSVTFTATVTANSPGTGTPTGKVTFSDDGEPIGTAPLNGSGVATFASTLEAGTTITASYSGDGNDTASTSAALTQTVNQAATTTALSSSANPSTAGQSVTFTATVTANSPGAGTPTGKVAFYAGGQLIGTAPLNGSGVATFSTSALKAGTYTITASYGGNFAASTSAALTQTVNQAATTTALSSSANPSVVGQSVTFTATVRVNPPGGGTPAGTVAFSDGGTAISGCGAQPVDAGTGTATCTVTYPSPGSHSITASYGGDGNDTASTSAALTQTVNKAATTTTLSSSANPSTAGNSVTFTATVTANSPGTGTPTGTVTFYGADGEPLGTATLNSSGVATLALTLDANTTITASYGGDGNDTASTSAALSQVVNPNNSTG